MAFGKKLEEMLEKKGISQSELARSAGISKTTLSSMLSRDVAKVDIELFLAICRSLDCQPEEFYQPRKNDYIVPAKGEASNVLPSENFRTFPLFASASAGFGSYADSQITEYYGAYVESHFIAKQTVAIRVRGDSMYPKIEDGDVILVQKDGVVKSGDIGVAVIGEEAFVKKIVYDKESVSLISINPEYAPKLFKGEERDTVHVVGRVYRIIKEC